MTKTKARRSTLTDDPTTAKIKGALAAKGFNSLSEAARSVGFGVAQFMRLVHGGVSSNPTVKTAERLRKLGIEDMVKRR